MFFKRVPKLLRKAFYKEKKMLELIFWNTASLPNFALFFAILSYEKYGNFFPNLCTCVADAHSCALDSTNERWARLHKFPGIHLSQMKNHRPENIF